MAGNCDLDNAFGAFSEMMPNTDALNVDKILIQENQKHDEDIE